MRVTICSAYLIAFLLVGAPFCNGAAQQSGAPPTLPPLMECGVHGYIEILCGARSPGLAGRGQPRRVSHSYDAAPGGLCALHAPAKGGMVNQGG
jgi:hypothetical protein